MAVLVEAISVIVRLDAIDEKLAGGWHQFLSTVPNATLCSDENLARVGFMSPQDIEKFVNYLETSGLTFMQDGKAIDFVVVDQMRGPTTPVEWLEFARISLGETENKVSACWLFEGERIAAGIHMPAKELKLATPDGWTYEESLSANFKFVENEKIK